MRLKWNVLVICAAVSQFGSVQAATSKESVKDILVEPASDVYHSNAVSIELMGRGGYYSFNYDRVIFPWLGVGAGLSYLNDGTNHLIIPVYTNIYALNPNGVHRGYLTAGYSFVTNTVSTLSRLSQLPNREAPVSFGLGYEYRGWNGLLFRVSPYLINIQSGLTATLGVTLGWAF